MKPRTPRGPPTPGPGGLGGGFPPCHPGECGEPLPAQGPLHPLSPKRRGPPGLGPGRAGHLAKGLRRRPRRLAEALEKAFSALGIVLARAEGPYALTDIPGAGVLLEIGVERLKTLEARNQVAEAIAQAIRTYLGE